MAVKPQVNIMALVDVIGALSNRSLLNGNLCLIDDGGFQSRAQGTPDLCTIVQPGQIVQWTALAVDLQTPVEIKNVSFIAMGNGAQAPQSPPMTHTPGPSASADDGADSDKLDLDVWTGVVPEYMVPGVAYKYRLEFQMYEGPHSRLHVDSPALMRV